MNVKQEIVPLRWFFLSIAIFLLILLYIILIFDGPIRYKFDSTRHLSRIDGHPPSRGMIVEYHLVFPSIVFPSATNSYFQKFVDSPIGADGHILSNRSQLSNYRSKIERYTLLPPTLTGSYYREKEGLEKSLFDDEDYSESYIYYRESRRNFLQLKGKSALDDSIHNPQIESVDIDPENFRSTFNYYVRSRPYEHIHARDKYHSMDFLENEGLLVDNYLDLKKINTDKTVRFLPKISQGLLDQKWPVMSFKYSNKCFAGNGMVIHAGRQWNNSLVSFSPTLQSEKFAISASGDLSPYLNLNPPIIDGLVFAKNVNAVSCSKMVLGSRVEFVEKNGKYLTQASNQTSSVPLFIGYRIKRIK